MAPADRLYRFHVTNLREVEKGLKNVAALARKAIAERDDSGQLQSLLTLFALVLGCWAETRLQKLLHEPGAFEPRESNEILRKRTRISQWKALVDLSFAKHFTVHGKSLSALSLGRTNFARYNVLQDTLDVELGIIIEIRNKLAHGQWIYPLNDEGTNVNKEHFKKLKEENIQSLQFKLALLRHIGDVVHDLSVSPSAFERDFDLHFRRLDQARINLSTRPYEKYAARLVAKRRRYRESRDPRP